MGLDITANRRILPAEGTEAYDDAGELLYDEGWFELVVNPDFPGREDGLEDGRAYRVADEAADEISFSAGPYSSYNRWRDELAQLAGYTSARAVWADPRPGPFVELIHFSDCEGTIGPTTSAKLARDFAAQQPSADAHPDPGFRSRYALWREAFDLAADGGCVRFH